MNVTLGETSEWFQNSSHICFASDIETKCGSKDICSQKGILLPLFIEVTWPWWLRVGLYFGGLVYSFVAVNIIADIFMCSIDAISSKTKIVKTMGPDGKEESVEVPVWNGTVANLMLMSLGPRCPHVVPCSLFWLVDIPGRPRRSFSPSWASWQMASSKTHLDPA